MGKVFEVGKKGILGGMFGYTLLDAIKKSRAGDIINLYPGEYEIPPYNIVGVTIQGVTQNAADVILRTNFNLASGKYVFRNLTLFSNANDRNTIASVEQVDVLLDNIIVKDTGSKSAAVYIANSNSHTVMNKVTVDTNPLENSIVNLCGDAEIKNSLFKTGFRGYAKNLEINHVSFNSWVTSESQNVKITNSIFKKDISVLKSCQCVVKDSTFQLENEEFIDVRPSDNKEIHTGRVAFISGEDTASIKLQGIIFQSKNIEEKQFFPAIFLGGKAKVDLHLKNENDYFARTGIDLVICDTVACPNQFTSNTIISYGYLQNIRADLKKFFDGYRKLHVISSKQLFYRMCNEYLGDIFVLEPGKYFLSGSWKVNTITFEGRTDNPKDVVLEVEYPVKILKKRGLTISNLTLIGNKGALLVNESDNVVFINNCIVKKDAGNKCLIFIKSNGRLLINNTQLIWKKGISFWAAENSHISVKNTIFRGIKVSDNAKLKIDNSKFRFVEMVGKSKGQLFDSHIEYGLFLSEFSYCNVSNCECEILQPATSNNVYAKVMDYSRLNFDNVSVNPNVSSINIVLNKDAHLNLNVKPQDDKKLPVKIISNDKIKDNLVIDTPQFLDIESQISDKVPESKVKPKKTALQELDSLIGLKKVKEQIHEFISTVKFNKEREAEGKRHTELTLHSLFLGNPGTGKTVVARLLGRILYDAGVLKKSKVVEVSRADLVSNHVGETAIKTRKKLEEATGGILFVDEAYSLYQENASNNWGQEALDEIMKYMEDHNKDIMLIFAGYPREMSNLLSMNPGMESRIRNKFEFEDYSPDEIAQIGELMLKNDEFKIEDKNTYDELVKEAYSKQIKKSNARWIRNIDQDIETQIAASYAKDNTRKIDLVTNEDLNKVFGIEKSSTNTGFDKTKDYQIQMEKLNSMIGLKTVKEQIKELFDEVIVNKKLGLKSNPDKPYHMAFEGAPGTGKTTVARVVSKMFYDLDILPKRTVIETDRTKLIGRYIGETEKNVERVINEAMGGVLFIDEAYQLNRPGDNKDFGGNAIESLLKALSDYSGKFVVIFAGYKEPMENFLDFNQGLRSRVPNVINFDSYTSQEIFEIIVSILKKKGYKFNSKLLEEIVIQKYDNIPQKEKANGRWAKNFVQKLETKQNAYLAYLLTKYNDIDEAKNQHLILSDETLEKMRDIHI